MIQLASIINIFKNFHHHKIITLLVLIIIFSFILCFFADDEFGGLTNIDTKINQIHRRVHGDNYSEVSESIYPPENRNLGSIFFNRFYFVVVSTTMLGYGDIYPKSFRVKLFTIIYVLLIFFIAFFQY